MDCLKAVNNSLSLEEGLTLAVGIHEELPGHEVRFFRKLVG
jgi:hypothetical protein